MGQTESYINSELKNLRDPPIAINMVTSFNLSGTVFGLEVSFLADTGVGVSLMNGKIWEKLKHHNVKVETTELHNIVGVNGHPINVHGLATVPLNIANKMYYQKFIIADNITAEGIIGMDFMEANKCVLDVAKRQLILEKLEPLVLVPSDINRSAVLLIM